MTGQKQQILDYMRAHNGITTYTAFQMRITRLAARIRELKDMGYNIISIRKVSENNKPYVLYKLMEEQK